MKSKKKKSKTSKLEERRKADALALAQLIYDIYQDEKGRNTGILGAAREPVLTERTKLS